LKPFVAEVDDRRLVELDVFADECDGRLQRDAFFAGIELDTNWLTKAGTIILGCLL
jgi:hypothetical protein